MLVARARAGRDPDGGLGGHGMLADLLMQRGRLREGREALIAFGEGQGLPTPLADDWVSIWYSLLGYPTPKPPKELSSLPDELTRWLNAAHAARGGRYTVLDEAIVAFETEAEGAAAAGAEMRSRSLGAFAQDLRAYGALARGDVESAAAEYAKPRSVSRFLIPKFLRYSIGKAYLERGDAAEALKYLRCLRHFYMAQAPSHYYLAEAYEALGDVENARLHYGRFLRWWEEADPELEPWKDRARRALERLAAEDDAD